MSRPLAFFLLSFLSSTQAGALTGPRFWPGFPGWPWGGVGGGADGGGGADIGGGADAADGASRLALGRGWRWC